MKLGRQVCGTLYLPKNVPEDDLTITSPVIKFGTLVSSGRLMKSVRGHCSRFFWELGHEILWVGATMRELSMTSIVFYLLDPSSLTNDP